MLTGTITAGAVVSCTVTVKLAEPVLPAASTAVQLTVVVVRPNPEPDTGLQVVATAPLTMSIADALKLTGAPVAPVASTVMLAGTVTTGGVVSTTVTVKLAEPVLPAASAAVHVTVVV